MISHGHSNEISGGVNFSTVIQGRNIYASLPETVPTALNGLPSENQAFVGRAADLDALTEILDPANSDSNKIAIIVGLAGVGKTELAKQAARAASRRGWFSGGVLFIDLFGYDPSRRVEALEALDSLLRSVGIPPHQIPNSLQDRSRLLASVFSSYADQGNEILLILDNAYSSAQVSPLIPSSARVLVTSRHTLADLGGRLIELSILDTEASIELIEKQLIVLHGPTEDRVAHDMESAIRVAELCAGLPLALHIVAALLGLNRRRPLQAMASDLEDAANRLDELTYRYGDDERAVRAAFNLSYRHLNALQARVFRLLTVNPGPDFSVEITEVLAGISSSRARKVLNALSQAHLIEQGLVDGRWRFHDLVRLYAEEQGERNPAPSIDKREQALESLLHYFHSVTSLAIRHLDPIAVDRTSQRFPRLESALAWLDLEYPNLKAALENVEETRSHDEFVNEFSHLLWNYLDWRRYLADWTKIANYGIQAARRLNDLNGEARSANCLGIALGELRCFEEALDAYETAREIYIQTGDSDGLAMVLSNLAPVMRDTGNPDEAIRIAQEAVAIYRSLDDIHGEGRALTNLSLILRQADRFKEAVTTSEAALSIFRQTNDLRGEGLALGGLALALLSANECHHAVRAGKAALAVYEHLDDRHGMATVLDSLGLAQASTRDYESGANSSRQAAAIFESVEDFLAQAKAMQNVGLILHEAGNSKEAAKAYVSAIEIFDRIGAIQEAQSAREALTKVRKSRRLPGIAAKWFGVGASKRD